MPGDDADDTAELLGVLRELEARPEAAVARAAMMQAHASLAVAADLAASRAVPARVTRQKQIAWSALLLADRAIARADLAAAHAGLSARTRQAEADAGLTPTAALDQTAKADPVLPADLAARAERARADAAHASDAAERADHALRAQLLLNAAQAEAERIVIERSVERLEERLAAAVLRRARAERDKLERQAEQRQQLASADQASLASRAFATLASTPVEVNSRAGAEADAQLVDFVLQRARARLAAATALEPGLAEITTARAKLTAISAAPVVKRRPLAVESLRLAEIALGAARMKRSPAGSAQARDLVQNAHERGFGAAWRADGVELVAAHAFAGASAGVAPEVQRRLELLRDLLPAYPHGSVRVSCSTTGDAPAALALARTRATAARDFLARTPARTRFELDAPAVASGTGADLHVLLSAYGGAPPASTTNP